MGVDDEMILAPIKTQSCRFLSGCPSFDEIVAETTRCLTGLADQMHEAADVA